MITGTAIIEQGTNGNGKLMVETATELKTRKINVSVCGVFPGEKLPKGDSRWATHVKSFDPQEITVGELIKKIRQGYSFSAAMMDGYRDSKHFISAQHLGLDFDTEDDRSSLDTLVSDPFIKKYAAFVYTSPSHTPEKPRARVVFILDKPVTDADKYSQYATVLTEKFELSDGQCKDAARFWYGSKDCDTRSSNNLLPVSVLDEMIEQKPKKMRKASGFRLPETVGDGNRNHTLFRLACSLQAKGLSDEAILTAVEVENEQRVSPSLDDSEVETIVKSALKYAKGQLDTDDEHLTDLGNAQRFVRLHKDKIKFCGNLKNSWLIWNGKYWQVSPDEQVTPLAIEVVKELYLQASKSEDSGERKALGDFARKSEGAYKINAMMELAKGFLYIDLQNLDVDKELVNFDNGILNMRTKELMAHDPNYLMTRAIPFAYIPDAKCPKWIEFLVFALDGDTDTIKWIQKTLGYTLAGRSDGRFLPFLFGSGGNGKSTFMQTLIKLFGEYSKNIPIEIILSKRFAKEGESPSAYLLSLKGARLVLTSEIPGNRSLNTSLVKDLTGGDILTARGLYEKRPVSWTPTHNVWMYGNDQPKIPDNSEGMWDRVKLIPFTKRIPDEMKRPMEEVIAEFMGEAEGILAWIVDGYRLALAEGLKPTETIARATKEYREEEDLLQKFIEEEMEEGGHIKKAEFRERYLQWCKDNGEDVYMSSSKLTRDMRMKGYELGGYHLKNFMGLHEKGE